MPAKRCKLRRVWSLSRGRRRVSPNSGSTGRQPDRERSPGLGANAESPDIGADLRSPVTPNYASPFTFSGKVDTVTVDLKN